jgi:hypothetical protein
MSIAELAARDDTNYGGFISSFRSRSPSPVSKKNRHSTPEAPAADELPEIFTVSAAVFPMASASTAIVLPGSLISFLASA